MDPGQATGEARRSTPETREPGGRLSSSGPWLLLVSLGGRGEGGARTTVALRWGQALDKQRHALSTARGRGQGERRPAFPGIKRERRLLLLKGRDIAGPPRRAGGHGQQTRALGSSAGRDARGTGEGRLGAWEGRGRTAWEGERAAARTPQPEGRPGIHAGGRERRPLGLPERRWPPTQHAGPPGASPGRVAVQGEAGEATGR